MKYLKLYNRFTESVTIEEEYSRHVLEGDNFGLPKYLKSKKVEDLDMYLQLIEDDGGVCEIGLHLVEEKFSNTTKNFLMDVEHAALNYKFIYIIYVYKYDSMNFIKEFKNKYKESEDWDINIRKDVERGYEKAIEIRFISKDVINVKDIIKQFNDDVEKFFNDNKDIMDGYTESFGFSTAISDCKCSNLDLLKDRLELFLNSYKYYIGVVLNRNRRMTFTISLSLN